LAASIKVYPSTLIGHLYDVRAGGVVPKVPPGWPPEHFSPKTQSNLEISVFRPALRRDRRELEKVMYQAAFPDWQEEEQSISGTAFSRLTRTPLLPPEQERHLARLARSGDESARKKLIEANMRLVFTIARNRQTKSISYEDLVQEGAIGLMHAVSRFDPDMGYRFSTYAIHWIRQTIMRAVYSKSRSIRLPSHMVEFLRKAEYTRSRLCGELGREPTSGEVAEALGVPTSKVEAAWACPVDVSSLDTLVGEDDSTSLLAMIPDECCLDPEKEMLDREYGRTIMRALRELPPREQEVICRRLGIESEEEAPLVEIGTQMRRSRERVRQIEANALRRLRTIVSKLKLNDPCGE
jgi:RNA polymerase sigma factor (sigma-70 family)